ncbi:hypothetical protein D3C81_1125850 [compost metagenome]
MGGARRIVRVGLEADIGIGHVAGEQGICPGLKAVENLVDDGLLVHRLVDRLAYRQITGSATAGVHRQGAGGQRCRQCGGIALVTQAHERAGRDLAGGALDQFDLAGLQGQRAAVGVWNDLDHDLAVGRLGPPVIRVAHEAVVFAQARFGAHPRAGPGGLAGFCLRRGKA